MGARDDLAGELDWAQGEFFFGRDLPAGRRDRLVQRLLDAQVRAGPRAGLFDPGTAAGPAHLFTGEPIRTRLAWVNLFTQESARTLGQLGGLDPAVQGALQVTADALSHTCYALRHCTVGECAISFIGYVRFLHSIDAGRASSEVAWRMQTLSRQRTLDSRWKRFPFYYTLLVLLELDGVAAQAELEFARAACLRALRARVSDAAITARRARVLSEALCRTRSDSAEAGRSATV
jgi:hypothetical protein